MNKEILDILLSKSEIDCLKQMYWYNDDISLCSNEKILNYFSDYNISILFDWAEINVESELINFLNYRLGQIGNEIKLGYNEMFQELTSYKYEKGEQLQYILKHYNTLLYKKGFSIVYLNFYSQKEDYYRIFLINKSDIVKLIKQNNDVWNFYSPYITE